MSHGGVSVIIPVYNGAAFLTAAVESIRAQADIPLDIVIVDDGSTDGSAEVVRGLPQAGLRYVYQDNAGPSRARNRGLALARSEVIGFLDADDLWPSGRLRRQLRALDGDAAVDVVLGRTLCVRWAPGEEDRFEECFPPFVLLSPTAALFRRRAFERVGIFDESLRYGEDTDWFMRARECGVRILVEDDVALLYRRHGDNMTHGRNMKELRVLDVLKRSLDRRRRHGAVAAPLPSLRRPPPRDADGTGSSDPGEDA